MCATTMLLEAEIGMLRGIPPLWCFLGHFVFGMPHLEKVKLDDLKQKIIEALFQHHEISVEFGEVYPLTMKEKNF